MDLKQNPYAHTHVLATLMGEDDPAFVATVQRPTNPKHILYVRLTETSPVESDLMREHGIARLSPEDLGGSPMRVLEWLRLLRAKKVAVHFDVDVLDLALYDFVLVHDPYAAPGTYNEVPTGRMRFEEVAAILNAVAAEADIVGLAIAEYMPWSAIKLSQSLRSLPLLGTGSGSRTRRLLA